MHGSSSYMYSFYVDHLSLHTWCAIKPSIYVPSYAWMFSIRNLSSLVAFIVKSQMGWGWKLTYLYKAKESLPLVDMFCGGKLRVEPLVNSFEGKTVLARHKADNIYRRWSRSLQMVSEAVSG